MENTIKDRFVFTYESGVTGSFLVASTSKDDNIIEFQVDMLAKNPNKHILPLDVRRNNDRINLYYNVTSQLSLSQYLSRNQIDKSGLVEIFIGIVKTLLASKGFLLSDNSFLLDAEYIYISPDSMNISLAYLPVKLDVDITKELKEFGVNLIVYGADVAADDRDSFLQQFLSFLKKDTFSIIAFDKFLREMKRTIIAECAQATDNVDEMYQVPLPVQNAAAVPKKPAKQNKPIEIPTVPQNRAQKENKVPQKEPPKSMPPQKSTQSSAYEKQAQDSIVAKLTASPNMLIGAAVQTVIVVAILGLVISGKLDAVSGDKVTSFFGLALVGGAASYFMWKNVMKIPVKAKVPAAKPVPDKAPSRPQNNIPARPAAKTVVPPIPETPRVEPPPRRAEAPRVEPPPRRVEPPRAEPPPRRAETPRVEPPPRRTPEIPHNLEETLKPPRNLDETLRPAYSVNETVLLGSNSPKFPHLQVFKDGGIEEVVIDKPSFIIGRLGGQVDYVHTNNAIGKVHAEIITRDGHYYLKDLNSRNGTYINDKRLDSNKEYEIKNNDKLTLADSKFIFVVFDN